MHSLCRSRRTASPRRRRYNVNALSEIVDLTLARSGEQFSIPDALIVLARWEHFTDVGLPWENAVTL